MASADRELRMRGPQQPERRGAGRGQLVLQLEACAHSAHRPRHFVGKDATARRPYEGLSGHPRFPRQPPDLAMIGKRRTLVFAVGVRAARDGG